MNMTHATGTGDSHQASGSAGSGSRRHVAFWVAGATLTLFLCGASAPSPLYAIYQAKFGFSATVLTAIFETFEGLLRGKRRDADFLSTAIERAVRNSVNAARGKKPQVHALVIEV